MRIERVEVTGYRCIARLSIEFGDLTALVGGGGVGKSAFFRALEWFFVGGSLEEADVHIPGGAEAATADAISVAVTFTDLNEGDRARLGKYAAGDSTTLVRRWNRETGEEKLSGRAYVRPEFTTVREGRADGGAAEVKRRYKKLYERAGEEEDFPTPANQVAQVEADMEQWEREHPDKCERRFQDDPHMLGYTGGALLNDRFDLVLVRASADAGEALATTRRSPLGRLLAALDSFDEETEAEINSLQEATQQRLGELMRSARATELERIEGAINERVGGYVPGAKVELADSVPEMSRPEPQVTATVRDQGGHATDVERQGHGLQRALVIAVLHELAESEALRAAEGTEPRSLMLAIEEPELYQHPLQARALASTLQKLGVSPTEESPRSIQVAYSSHSAHFVRPALFENLRLCSRGADGAMTAVAASREKVKAILDQAGFDEKIGARIETTLAKTLAEAVFSKVALLCEGRQDVAVLEAVAELDGGFDHDGIAVVSCNGKSVIPVAAAILGQFGIPAYVHFDGDAGAAERLAAADRTQGEIDGQLEAIARKNRQLLALSGEQEVDWPEARARARCSNFADRPESDLAALWGGLEEVRERLAAELDLPARTGEIYRQAIAELGDPPDLLREIVAAVRALRL